MICTGDRVTGARCTRRVVRAAAVAVRMIADRRRDTVVR